MEELKPCPFCGGAAVFEDGGFNHLRVDCANFHGCVKKRRIHKDEPNVLGDLTAAWNTRSERPADPAGEISGHTPWSDIKQRVLDRLQTENAKLEAQLLASQAECERVKGERNCLDDKVQALTRPVSDEAWKVIADAVETLTIWSRQDFTNPDGSTPMWNPTLRRLRNLLATRAQSTPPSPAPDAVRDALEIACAYGGIDGGHHKMWVIDQMVRRLTGDDYDAWVREHNKGEDGPDTYAWDQGIAP